MEPLRCQWFKLLCDTWRDRTNVRSAGPCRSLGHPCRHYYRVEFIWFQVRAISCQRLGILGDVCLGNQFVYRERREHKRRNKLDCHTRSLTTVCPAVYRRCAEADRFEFTLRLHTWHFRIVRYYHSSQWPARPGRSSAFY